MLVYILLNVNIVHVTWVYIIIFHNTAGNKYYRHVDIDDGEQGVSALNTGSRNYKTNI